MIPAKVLYNLVVVDKMFMEVKIRNVRDFLVINDELVIFTYFDKFRSRIYLKKSDCYQVYIPLQHNKKEVIF